MDSNFPAIPQRYLTQVRTLMARGGRQLLGLVGSPGCGKSTLAQALLRAFPRVSQVVPMDGFHLANVELRRLGRAERKGAPDTFDSAGFAALLHRLRTQRSDDIIYAPEFRREIEEPIAGAIPVLPETQLLIVEGNYLLLDVGAWSEVARTLDDCWYIETEEALRLDRLLSRHQQFGRSRQEAVDWIAATDEPNTRVIEATRERARTVFTWDAA